MSMGADNSLATVPMDTKGFPIGGSDGAFIRTLYVGPDGAAKVSLSSGSSSNTPVASSAVAQSPITTGGALIGVLVTTAGSAALTIYDSASTATGNVVGYIPANAPAGQIYPFNMPYANGLTLSGDVNNPSVTLSTSTSMSAITPGGAGPITYNVGVPVQAGVYVALARAGTLNGLLVTAVGTVAMTIYDHASAASGTVLAVVPANTPAGTIIPLRMPAANGITVSGSASNPAVTLSLTASTSPANVAVPVQAGAYVVKAGPGVLHKALVTVVGTVAMSIYDNPSAASGTVIGYIPANAPAGQVYSFEMPAGSGITVSGSASNPAVTLSIE